ncbi:lysylphosphatidylglycerol synthase transmembrane domain-containing protein [Dysgonomonas macrotermitis]|uniref:Lysylphosphatidylglycerol synthase TM region n=1 Tax=Dysgonomonas macrotermitis TaxID=1346286 RepID=A0A1M5I687_9BACT|nr:lysylphosphatidylglycerol synthase transmembrane domain-containing protein [Dysgonomonas macrotermitis]SHG23864.1 hypothetical protein SAMN05444362_11862 [Dysgonomonas macrotermitis]
MQNQSGRISLWKILLPTFLGIGVIVFMFVKDLSGSENAEQLDQLRHINITGNTVFWFFIALLLMVGRDLGFTIRYRYLTEKLLSWKQSLKITLLAEFGTAVTPSSVGGSSMAILFLTKEKIPVGKSTAMVFITMLLDEMFFVVTFPLLLLFVPVTDLFPEVSAIQIGVVSLFIVAYIVKLLLCICLVTGLFFKPQSIKWLLIQIFKLPFLRRWSAAAEKAGNDLIISSGEIRGKNMSYWLPLIFATILSWCSRFFVVNALFMAFFPVGNHLLIFGRQFVMWVLMILSFTPGASGLSEIIFKQYLSALIPVAGLVPVIILLWRLLSYYNYLFVGAILVPKWASKAFSKQK